MSRKIGAVSSRNGKTFTFDIPISVRRNPQNIQELLYQIDRALKWFTYEYHEPREGDDELVRERMLNRANALLKLVKKCRHLEENEDFKSLAFQMFKVGELFYELEHYPFLHTAIKYENNLGKAADSSNKNYNERFADLKEIAKSEIAKQPDIRLGQLSELLASRYHVAPSTLSRRLKKLHKEEPFLPASAFKSGRPKTRTP